MAGEKRDSDRKVDRHTDTPRERNWWRVGEKEEGGILCRCKISRRNVRTVQALLSVFLLPPRKDGKLQALVYDILPSRKVPESEAWSV